jgi:hypothetical protein
MSPSEATINYLEEGFMQPNTVPVLDEMPRACCEDRLQGLLIGEQRAECPTLSGRVASFGAGQTSDVPEGRLC